MLRALVIAATQAERIHAAIHDAGCVDIASAASVETAIAQHGRDRPDLVVLDVSATEAALQACRQIASRFKDAPLLVISTADAIEAAFDAGATDCIATPVRDNELVARIRTMLRVTAERMRRHRRERRLTDELRALQRQKQDLERVVCADALTGIANRRHALALLRAEWKRSARDGSPLSIVMIDLDCFHEFNERYGHVGGDGCLRRVTDAMTVALRRPSDVLGRYGGEEFIAVLAHTDAEGARLVADRLRADVEQLAIPHERSACARVVTISAGFATCRPNLEADVDVLVAAADHALLRAKRDGRNRVAGEAPPTVARPTRSSEPWRRFPIVIADPWFADRIPQYLTGLRAELGTFRAACDAHGFDRLRSLARSLRSGALEFGFDAIVQLAQLIDHAARAADPISSRQIFDELELYLDHVQVTYRRPLVQAG